MFRAVRPIYVALLITAFIAGQSASWLHVAAHVHESADSHSHCDCDGHHCHSHATDADHETDQAPSGHHDSHDCSICHWFCQAIDVSTAAVDFDFIEASSPLALRKQQAAPLLAFVQVFLTRGPPVSVA